MSLFNEIKTALVPLDILTRRLRLNQSDKDNNPDQYIIVYFLDESGALYADDEEIATSHFIQVSLFTRLNFVNTVKQIKNLLKPLGFRRTNEYEIYEDETGYFHKVIRFSYVQNQEDGE